MFIFKEIHDLHTSFSAQVGSLKAVGLKTGGKKKSVYLLNTCCAKMRQK